MKMLLHTFHFLGSFTFAMILLAFLACIVCIGTILESLTDSHSFAAIFTYRSHAFQWLLIGVFINILLSALRRWPFKKKHIPFLITHFGLLMIISGVILKNIFGIQGVMQITEGSASHEVLIPGSYVVRIEKNDAQKSCKEIDIQALPNQVFDLSCTIVHNFPHSEVKLKTWIKGSLGYIAGLNPFPVFDDPTPENPIPISSKVKLFPNSSEIWDIYALKTNQPKKILSKLYFQNSTSSDTDSMQLLFDLKEDGPISHATLQKNEKSSPISISASDMLTKKEWQTFFTSTPKLIFLEDEEENILFVAIDRYGNLYSDYFPSKQMRSMIVYDSGFGSYSAYTHLPFYPYSYGPEELKDSKIYALMLKLRELEEDPETLLSPLKEFYEACYLSNNDFAQSLIELMQLQEKELTENELADFELLARDFNWSLLPEKVFKSCYWTSYIQQEKKNASFLNLQKHSTHSKNLGKQLIEVADKLPVPPQLNQIPDSQQIIMLTEYLKLYGFTLSSLLPQAISEKEAKRFLDHYVKGQRLIQELHKTIPAISKLKTKQKIDVLKNFKKKQPSCEIIERIGIDTLKKQLPLSEKQEDFSSFPMTLEAPVSPHITSLEPTKKLESNRPAISLLIKKNHQKQIVHLIYDPLANDLFWPIFNGEYRLRFQPKTVCIPQKVHLHCAKQINYPGSSQPQSFESEIVVTDKNRKKNEDVTLSMNRVYESSDGYRFYLSSITPTDETQVKQVQLTINYDPFKYFLTYPGSVLVGIGIILLFWMRPYKKRHIRKKQD